MAQAQRDGYQGTAPSNPSPTFQRRGVRDRAAVESTGPTDDRVQVPDPQNLPWRMVCALTIVGASGAQRPGTGWLAGPRTVITAGHCVFDPVARRFPSTIVITPGLNGASAPFGQLTSRLFRSLPRWMDNGDLEFDVGAITLDRDIGRDVGFFAAAARGAADLQTRLAHVSGYPDVPGGGLLQFHHRNRITGATGRRLFYETDTSEGQSGAPVWVLDSDGGAPIVVGVHTYGHDRTPPPFQPANSATLINPDVLAQIGAWVREDGGA